MRRLLFIIAVLLLIGCANNESRRMKIETTESLDIPEETTALSDSDAYMILIKQKLQEHLDRKALAKSNPDFAIETDRNTSILTTEGTQIKHIDFITPIKTTSDSIKEILIKVVTEQKTDTIMTIINTSKIEIDGELLTTTKVSFDTIKK
ncbi:hypothetical protein [Aquimarina aquimarini]|uniref:hypothetical protein n=1 Tax=Aquimarina aquimarini TaxID=1191734 RepID=UPI000D54C300|nr:hypothetical protein [Aquimarina aquimarini]